MAQTHSQQLMKLQFNIEEIDRQKPSPVLSDEKSGFSDQIETLSQPSSRGLLKSRTSPKPLPKYQYTKEELMGISMLPVARKRPSCLDLEFNNSSGLWDPLNWFSAVHQEEQELVEEKRMKCERPYEVGKETGAVHKRRTSDPKERIKEENETIVLSPQRRSFGTGCHIPQQVSKQPGNSYESKESESAVCHEPVRRIGSGRILAHNRDQCNKDQQEREYGYNRCNGNRRNRLDRDDREKEGRLQFSEYGEKRFEREEEPEWFSEGPASHSETIELVGFNFHQEDKREGRHCKGKKSQESFQKLAFTQQDNEEANDSRKASSEDKPTTVECKQAQKFCETVGQLKKEEELESKQNPHNPDVGELFKSTATVQYEEAQENHETLSELKTEKKPESKQTSHNFDINDLFKNDLIPELLPNSIRDEPLDSQGVASSRFSQWFRRDSPVHIRLDSNPNSRRSSFQDELVAHMLSGIEDSTSPPSGVNNYFAPISPTVTQSYSECKFSPHQLNSQESEQDEDKNILELLHVANISLESILNGAADKMENCELDHKKRSIEDLDTDIKKFVLGNKNKEEDKLDNNAFNEQLNQVGQDTESSIMLTVPPVDRSKLIHESDLLENMVRGNTPTPPLLPNIIPTVSPSHVSASSSLRSLAGGYGDLMSLVKGGISSSGVQNVQGLLEFSVGDNLAHLLNQKQGISVHMLAKLLNVQEPTPVSNQSFCDPVSVQTSSQGFTNIHINSALCSSRTDPHSIQAVIDQRQQREFFSTLQKCPSLPQQQQPCGSNLQSLGVPNRHSPCQSPSLQTGQGRIPSPLVFGQQPPLLSHAPAPVHPSQTSRRASTLQVQPAAVLPRVPSPQELAVHTQSILQNALIKRKLEEQKENFRRRQETQRTQSPSIPSMINKPAIVNGSSPKGLSPTMAAFTPTSVLRKMQSDRERESPVEKSNQPAVFPIKKSLNISTVPIVTVRSHQSPTQVQGSDNINSDHQNKNHQALETSSQVLWGHGQPSLKGSSSQSTAGDRFDRGGSKIGAVSRKSFLGPTQSVAQEYFVKLMEQQHLLQQQQTQALLAAQRQLNAPTAFCMGSSASTTLNNNLVRPGSVGLGHNLNIMLLRNFVLNNMNIHNVRGPMSSLNYLAYFLILQQQQGLDIRQVHALAQGWGIHPLAFQQLQLLMSQNQAPVVSSAPNFNPLSAVTGVGGSFGNMSGTGRKHLMPVQSVANRQSPVNLSKWFRSDVLKQQMPEMPPVPHQRAYLVEELERQQQAASVHH
ncbi:uncharacterized protein LOC143244753 isoform X4 [Tachypleus tridentatus]|uniref:uncharacterized protein LOC143244753 isoform X4 n=2 Tax=Tachypleus tridentatus TaxID=6853 RepID=UPI003FD4F96F